MLENLPEKLVSFIKNNQEPDAIPYQVNSLLHKAGRMLLAGLLLPYSVFRIKLVKADEIGLLWEGGIARFYEPGWHVLLNPTKSLTTVPIKQEVIQHGNYTVLRVAEGKLGNCHDTKTGKPYLLPPGLHVIESAEITINEKTPFLNVNEDIQGGQQIGFSNMQFLRVPEGETDITVDQQGKLQALNEGMHVLDADCTWKERMSKRQQVLSLGSLSETSQENVKIKVEADVYYEITDPRKSALRLQDNITYMKEIARSVLLGIIRSLSITQVSASSTLSHAQKTLPSEDTPKAKDTQKSNIYHDVHKQFMAETVNHFEQYGIKVDDIRIEAIQIDDHQLNQQMTAQAVRSSKIQGELANAQAERALAEQKQSIEQTRAETEKLVRTTQAQAAAEATTIKAKADAEAISLKAEAESNAIELKGKAKAAALKAQGASLEGCTGAQTIVAAQTAREMMSQVKTAIIPAGGDNGLAGMLATSMMGAGLFKNPESSLEKPQTNVVQMNNK